MTKFLKTLVVALVALSLVACSSNKAPETTDQPSDGTDQPSGEKISIGFVTDIGGIDDKSFNQTSYEGIKDFAAEAGLVENTDFSYLVSSVDADYKPNLTQFVNEEVDIIVAAGFLFANAIQDVVTEFPDQKMLIIDVDWLEGENLLQAVFAENEGSFLVGVVAGLTAKNAGKDTVGFIIGEESVTMNKFWAGYQEGVWAVYPECKILYDNANSFGEPEKGKTLAAKQYNAGAYVVYHAAGGTGNGVIAEAAERRASGEDIWVCGVDTDQYHYGIYEGSLEEKNEKSAVLTSMLKRVDLASYDAVKAVADGTFKGGVVKYTLANDGVGLPENNPNVPEELITAAKDYAAKIKAGEITVSEVPLKVGEDDRIK